MAVLPHVTNCCITTFWNWLSPLPGPNTGSFHLRWNSVISNKQAILVCTTRCSGSTTESVTISVPTPSSVFADQSTTGFAGKTCSPGTRADVRKVQTTADQFRTRYGLNRKGVLGRLTGLNPDRIFHVQTWSTRGAAVAISVMAANEPEPEGCLPRRTASETRSELLDWLEYHF